MRAMTHKEFEDEMLKYVGDGDASRVGVAARHEIRALAYGYLASSPEKQALVSAELRRDTAALPLTPADGAKDE